MCGQEPCTEADTGERAVGAGATRLCTKAGGWCRFFVSRDHCVIDLVGGMWPGWEATGRSSSRSANVSRVEWDPRLFFHGILLRIGAFGYLAIGSDFDVVLGATTASIVVGFASAIFHSIPVMFAVLESSLSHWQLITLAAGVGGSMLAVGSATGLAVLGHAHGTDTFFGHLKWSWAMVLGYGASIWSHLLMDSS